MRERPDYFLDNEAALLEMGSGEITQQSAEMTKLLREMGNGRKDGGDHQNGSRPVRTLPSDAVPLFGIEYQGPVQML